LPKSRIMVCSALTPSIGLGEEWSMTSATFSGSKTSSTPMLASARMASGEVPSCPMTKSTSAMTMSPARASESEWAEKIFSAIVFPGIVITLPIVPTRHRSQQWCKNRGHGGAAVRVLA
jgi:hypothetical protein